jgi:hypothetical protein
MYFEAGGFTFKYKYHTLRSPNVDYLNLSLADEHVGDVTIPTQVIENNHNFIEAD